MTSALKKWCFWEGWKNITPLEQEAIRAIEFGRGILLSKIPQEEIVSIYVKGTFPRREMNGWSDVDLVVVLKSDRYVPTVNVLNREVGKEHDPVIGFAKYTLDELQRNKSVHGSALPDHFVKRLPYFELIYGEDLSQQDFPTRSDEEILKDFAQTVQNKFIPEYQEGSFGWMQLIKTALWLGDLEQRVFQDHPPVKRWHDLPMILKNPHPAILHALDIRDREGTKGQSERDQFAEELNDYAIQLLEKLKSN